MSRVGRRAIYIALALVTIAIGLAVHLGGAMFGATARDIVGDALWAAMIVWWIGAIIPNAPSRVRFGIAYGICVVVEVSQAYHTPLLDSLRANRLGQLVLGSGFDARDLLAYAVGVGMAAFLDVAFIRRKG